MFLAIAAVTTGGVLLATNVTTVDADDINRGIGTTEVWEPGPEDGDTDTTPIRPFDANKRSEYRELEKPAMTSFAPPSDTELLDKLERIRDSNLSIGYSAIDYENGLVVIYSPETDIHEKIESVIGNTPYMIVQKDMDPLRNSFSDGPTKTEEPEIRTQSFKGFLDDVSIFSILPLAYATSDTAYGTAIDSDTSNTYTGAYAKLEVHNSGWTLPSDVTVFGGTLMPTSNSGLEIAIRYTDGDYEFTVYDHYAGSFTVIEDMDSTWMGTYANTISGSKYIYVEVLENQGTWIAKIYNFDNSSYQTLDSQMYDGSRSDGWSVWEEYNMAGQCQDITIPEVVGDLVKIRDSNGWHYVSNTYGSSYSDNIPCMSETMTTNYYKWKVN